MKKVEEQAQSQLMSHIKDSNSKVPWKAPQVIELSIGATKNQGGAGGDGGLTGSNLS